ncbi:MAG: heat-inducible transcriptional repressor HrcA [Micrococcales bacterium]
MISERSFEVLRAIVEDYVSTREPVGSKALLERHGFGVSSATIRNDMSILEEEGLIHAPHTSAGRVPTDSGYRLFVDRLNEIKQLSAAERQAMETLLSGSADLDEILSRSVRLLSQLTNQVAMVQYPTLGKARARGFELVPVSDTKIMVMLISDNGRVQQHVVELGEVVNEAVLVVIRDVFRESIIGKPLAEIADLTSSLHLKFEHQYQNLVKVLVLCLQEQVDANRQDKLVLAGTSNLVRAEGDFGGNLSPLLDAIDEQVVLLRLISEMQAEQHGVSVLIGSENRISGLSQASVLVSGYGGAEDSIAKVGVLGPTRMDYSTNISAVRAIARYLSKSLGA